MTSVTAFGVNGPKHVGSVAVELEHRLDRRVERARRGDSVALGLKHDAGAERLREEERVAGLRARLRPDRVRVHRADDREPVLRLVVSDRVPARENRARSAHALVRSGEDVSEHLDRQLFGKRGDRERHERRAAHREDVVQRVRRGDRAEGARVVDERREEVDGEDDRALVVQPVDRRVVGGIEPDEQILRLGGYEPREQRLESSCRVLGGATARTGERGERDGLHPEKSRHGKESRSGRRNRRAERKTPFSSPPSKRPPPPRRPLVRPSDSRR